MARAGGDSFFALLVVSTGSCHLRGVRGSSCGCGSIPSDRCVLCFLCLIGSGSGSGSGSGLEFCLPSGYLVYSGLITSRLVCNPPVHRPFARSYIIIEQHPSFVSASLPIHNPTHPTAPFHDPPLALWLSDSLTLRVPISSFDLDALLSRYLLA